MSLHQTGDIHVEREGTAASELTSAYVNGGLACASAAELLSLGVRHITRVAAASFRESFSRFIKAALESGNAVAASHLVSLRQTLQAQGSARRKRQLKPNNSGTR